MNNVAQQLCQYKSIFNQQYDNVKLLQQALRSRFLTQNCDSNITDISIHIEITKNDQTKIVYIHVAVRDKMDNWVGHDHAVRIYSDNFKILNC